MVDVSMCKDDVIDCVGIEAQVAIHGIGFEAFSLEHATIEQDLFAGCRCDEVFTAGYFAGRTEEFDFHGIVLMTHQTYGIKSVIGFCGDNNLKMWECDNLKIPAMPK